LDTLSGLSCTAAATCQVTGSTISGVPVLMGTTTAGETWSPEKVPAGVASIGAMTCSTTTSCQAVGWDSVGGVVILRDA
jgi:hypothetical protein